jgi:hypothetical protein
MGCWGGFLGGGGDWVAAGTVFGLFFFVTGCAVLLFYRPGLLGELGPEVEGVGVKKDNGIVCSFVSFVSLSGWLGLAAAGYCVGGGEGEGNMIMTERA